MSFNRKNIIIIFIVIVFILAIPMKLNALNNKYYKSNHATINKIDKCENKKIAKQFPQNSLKKMNYSDSFFDKLILIIKGSILILGVFFIIICSAIIMIILFGYLKKILYFYFDK